MANEEWTIEKRYYPIRERKFVASKGKIGVHLKNS